MERLKAAQGEIKRLIFFDFDVGHLKLASGKASCEREKRE